MYYHMNRGQGSSWCLRAVVACKLSKFSAKWFLHSDPVILQNEILSYGHQQCTLLYYATLGWICAIITMHGHLWLLPAIHV